MHLSNLESPAGDIIGLRVDIQERRPGLVLESSSSHRLRLSIHGEPLCWCRVEETRSDVWTLRRQDPFELNVIPPIRFQEARTLTAEADWHRYFARALYASNRSPFRSGTWHFSSLKRMKPSLSDIANDRVPDVFHSVEQGSIVEDYAYGLLASLNRKRCERGNWGDESVLPLRTLGESDQGRIKAFRKLAREGALPPILLWWVSGFQMYVILDGHDRLAAAVAENVSPKVVVCGRSMSQSFDVSAEWRSSVASNYELAFQNETKLSVHSRDQLNRQLVWAFEDSFSQPITVAQGTLNDKAWNEEILEQLGDAEHPMLCD